MIWEGLSPPYATIVADPPWIYEGGWPAFVNGKHGGDRPGHRPLPYSGMTIWEIAALPVTRLADKDAHLYLWTTHRYLRDAYMIAEAWKFKPAKVLTWCKAPMGLGPGGTFATTTEFILFCRRGSLPAKRRVDSTWWQWPRAAAVHSVKPSAFLDLVEQVSPGPYVELFARQPRLGWDSWGHGFENFNGAKTPSDLHVHGKIGPQEKGPAALPRPGPEPTPTEEAWAVD